MAAKQTPQRKYIVKLSDEERERLNTLIQTGKHRARQVLKARILLKADASEAGDAWRLKMGILAAFEPLSVPACPARR